MEGRHGQLVAPTRHQLWNGKGGRPDHWPHAGAMIQIVIALQLLGFILGGSAFLLKYDV